MQQAQKDLYVRKPEYNKRLDETVNGHEESLENRIEAFNRWEDESGFIALDKKVIRLERESRMLRDAYEQENDKKQEYRTIKSFAQNVRDEEYFTVDLTDERGNVVGYLEYDGKIYPERIIADIKYFYQTGEIRGQSVSAYLSVRSSAKTDRELLEDRIKSLEKQGKLDQKELERLYETVYDLSVDLDKAGSDIKSHKATLEKTVEQLQKYQQQAETYHQIERETTEALDALDKLVKDGADPKAIQKQRAKLTATEKRMSEALTKLTQTQESSEIQDLLKREREIQRKRTSERVNESVNRRALRGKVDKLRKDLNKRITNPSEKKNIPVPVMQQAIEVLEAINMDASREGSVWIRFQKFKDSSLARGRRKV